jgi:peptidoglycan hydrolase-like protein with peptidoglycan-binding domain
MKTHLSAGRNRPIITTIAAAVLFALGLTAAPSPARAARAHTTPILMQGIGLKAEPSVRVRELQRVLLEHGFDPGAPGVDGRFGPLTAAAVRRMQDYYGLTPDGIVGSRTHRVINLIAAERPRALRDAARDRPGRTSRGGQQRAAGPSRSTTANTPRQQGRGHTTRPQPALTDAIGRARPAPGRQTTTAPATVRTERADTTASTLLALFAALLATAALAMQFLGRRRSEPELVPIEAGLYLEGRSDDPGVGAFRGFGLAAAVPARRGGAERTSRYLVDDPRKAAPVWVRAKEVERSRSRLSMGEPVIGYVTADDPAHDDNGSSRIHDAVRRIETICAEAGWDLRDVVRDDVGGSLLERPGLRFALDKIAAGGARALVVSDSSTVTSSLSDLAALLEWFRDFGAALILDDLALDTADAHGRHTKSTLIGSSLRTDDRTGHGRDTVTRTRRVASTWRRPS